MPINSIQQRQQHIQGTPLSFDEAQREDHKAKVNPQAVPHALPQRDTIHSVAPKAQATQQTPAPTKAPEGIMEFLKKGWKKIKEIFSGEKKEKTSEATPKPIPSSSQPTTSQPTLDKPSDRFYENHRTEIAKEMKSIKEITFHKNIASEEALVAALLAQLDNGKMQKMNGIVSIQQSHKYSEVLWNTYLAEKTEQEKKMQHVQIFEWINTGTTAIGAALLGAGVVSAGATGGTSVPFALGLAGAINALASGGTKIAKAYLQEQLDAHRGKALEAQELHSMERDIMDSHITDEEVVNDSIGFWTDGTKSILKAQRRAQRVISS